MQRPTAAFRFDGGPLRFALDGNAASIKTFGSGSQSPHRVATAVGRLHPSDASGPTAGLVDIGLS